MAVHFRLPGLKSVRVVPLPLLVLVDGVHLEGAVRGLLLVIRLLRPHITRPPLHHTMLPVQDIRLPVLRIVLLVLLTVLLVLLTVPPPRLTVLPPLLIVLLVRRIHLLRLLTVQHHQRIHLLRLPIALHRLLTVLHHQLIVLLLRHTVRQVLRTVLLPRLIAQRPLRTVLHLQLTAPRHRPIPRAHLLTRLDRQVITLLLLVRPLTIPLDRQLQTPNLPAPSQQIRESVKICCLC